MEFSYDKHFWQGDRVRLRPFRPEDWEADYQQFLDSETRLLIECRVELPVNAEEYRRLFSEDCSVEDKATRTLSFAVENRAGEFVGWINMHSRSDRNGTFSCGMGIFRPFRGQGFGEEALRLLLRYGFYELRYQKCNVECLAENQASIRLQQRLGFVQEGLKRRTVFHSGAFHDEYLSGLTREEFEANDREYQTRTVASPHV